MAPPDVRSPTDRCHDGRNQEDDLGDWQIGAIGRTLNTAGCDSHDLADLVEPTAMPGVVDQPRQEAPPAPELKLWRLTAMHCIRADTGRRKPAKLDFLRGLDYCPGEPSDKPARWLDAIAAALGLEVPA